MSETSTGITYWTNWEKSLSRLCWLLFKLRVLITCFNTFRIRDATIWKLYSKYNCIPVKAVKHCSLNFSLMSELCCSQKSYITKVVTTRRIIFSILYLFIYLHIYIPSLDYPTSVQQVTNKYLTSTQLSCYNDTNVYVSIYLHTYFKQLTNWQTN